MELSIELQDHENVVHNSFQFKFNNQVTLEKLQETINTVFSIGIEHQKMFVESGKELIGGGENSLQSFGLQDCDTVIVKHALLDTWSTYMFLGENAKDSTKAKPERIEWAHRANAESKKLENSGFLGVYAKFVNEWADILCQIMSLADRTQNALKESAVTFFSKMHPNSKIDFKPKQGGSRTGIVVSVTCNEEETNYYMKTYHNAGSSFSLQNDRKQPSPDLREMFTYRLRELIGVGPVVFFPFYAGSAHIHFIATKEVCEFKELDKIEDVSEQNKVVVEAYLLSLILGIRDLHEENIGLTKEKTLSIVDFYVPDADNFLRRKIFDDFKNKSNISREGRAIEILAEIGHEERMKIGKDALPRWSRISSLTSDIIGNEKCELRENGIKFGNCTNDVTTFNTKANTCVFGGCVCPVTTSSNSLIFFL